MQRRIGALGVLPRGHGAAFRRGVSREPYRSLITSRMVKKASQAKLLDKMSYGELMEDLSSDALLEEPPAVL